MKSKLIQYAFVLLALTMGCACTDLDETLYSSYVCIRKAELTMRG
ncbi:hypothetical protein [Sangeribacter muris]|nr:hypothetical protein [Sangeribacter muris]